MLSDEERQQSRRVSLLRDALTATVEAADPLLSPDERVWALADVLSNEVVARCAECLTSPDGVCAHHGTIDRLTVVTARLAEFNCVRNSLLAAEEAAAAGGTPLDYEEWAHMPLRILSDEGPPAEDLA